MLAEGSNTGSGYPLVKQALIRESVSYIYIYKFRIFMVFFFCISLRLCEAERSILYIAIVQFHFERMEKN